MADSNDLARLIVEQSPDGVIFAGPDGNIELWNEAAAQLFGFAIGDALGKNLDIIIPEALRDAHWKGFERAMEAGETKHKGKALPTKATRADGEAIYVELSFAIIKDASGKPVGALAHARDINERFEQDRANRRHMRDLEAEVKTLREATAG